MFVKKDYFKSIYELGEEKINNFIDKWNARIDVVNEVEGDGKYQLHIV